MSSTIKALVRMRPVKPGEIHDSAIHIHDHCTEPKTSNCVRLPSGGNREEAEFRFSNCFSEKATQSLIFEQDVAPLVSSVFKGLTVTVMAYGVTSSGKTYTIEGDDRDPGITPRVIKSLFANMPENCTPTVSMSYMELYREDVYDLLADPGKKTKLQIREKPAGEVFVEKLSSAVIRSVQDFRKIYTKAAKQRSAGFTKLNEVSSRSHAILTFETVVVDTTSKQALTGRFRIVDLAGSENNKLTGNTEAARMAESSAINKSLTTLSKVVKAINDGASRIPYRDSKLTRILQNSLGGDAICLMICNIAPVLALRRDVYNTLLFANGIQKVKNKPKANVSDLPVNLESASANDESRLRRSARGHESRRWKDGEVIVMTPIELQELVQREVQAAVALALASAPAHKDHGIKHEALDQLPAMIKQEAVEERKISIKQEVIEERPAFVKQEEVPERPSRFEQKGEEQRLAPVQQEVVKERPCTIKREVVEEWPATIQQEPAEEQSAELEQDPLEAQVTPEPTVTRESPVFTAELYSAPTPAEDTSTSIDAKDTVNQQELLRHQLEQLEHTMNLTPEVGPSALLSPTSGRRVAKAWVRLARIHTQQGKLASAVEYFRKAEMCQPNNSKLRDRIVELEYCIKNNKPYVQSPVKQRQARASHSPGPKSSAHSRDETGGSTQIQRDRQPPKQGGTSHPSQRNQAYTPAKRKFSSKAGFINEELDPTAAPKKRRSSDR